jgi:hypothetical protein
MNACDSKINHSLVLANCLSRMTGKSKTVFKKHIYIENSKKAAYKNQSNFLSLLY